MLHRSHAKALFSDDGWTDCLAEFDSITEKLKPNATVFAAAHEDEALSFPEAFDPKTDTGCFDVLPMPLLVKQGVVAKASQLSVDEVHGALDLFVCIQALFLKGTAAPFGACSFLIDRSLADTDVLKVCTQAMCRSFHSTTRYILDAGIRDGDEEFSSSLVEWDGFIDTLPMTHEIVTALDALIQKGAAGDVTQRMVDHMVYQRDCLKILYPIQAIGGDEAAVLQHLKEATESLEKIQKSSNLDESPQNVGRIYHEAAMMSANPVKLCTMKESFDTVGQLISDLKEISGWVKITGLYTLSDTVKAFGAREPCLLSRSLAQLFIVDQHMSVMRSEKPLAQWIVEALEINHGSPVYKAIYFSTQPLFGEAVDYRISIIGARGEKVRPAVQQETVRHMHGWAREAATCVSLLLRSHLRTRGRHHRGMMNLIQQIGPLQRQSAELDGTMFVRGGLPSSVSPQIREAISRGAVLTGFANHLMAETMLEMFGQTVKLNLLTKPEMPVVLFYRVTISSFRHENLSTLFPSSSLLIDKAQSVARKGPALYGPAVYAREARTSNSVVGSTAEMLRQSAHGALLLFSAIHTRIPGVEHPSTHLQSLETIIEGRFFCLLHSRGPTAAPYKDIKRQIDQMGQNPAQSITQAHEIFTMLIGTIKAVRAKKGKSLDDEDYANSAFAEPLVNAIDRAAKESMMVTGALKVEIEKAKASNRPVKEILAGFQFEFNNALHPLVTSYKLSLVQ